MFERRKRENDNELVWDNGEEGYQKLEEKRYLILEKTLAGDLERVDGENRPVRGQ